MFTICAFGLFYLAIDAFRLRWQIFGVIFLVLGLLFLANMFFVITSRTALLTLPFLLLLLGFRQFGWKGTAAALAIGVVVAGCGLGGVPECPRPDQQPRVEIKRRNRRTIEHAGRRAARFLEALGRCRSAEAPMIGHGTGSIRETFRRSALGHGASAVVSANPHNQSSGGSHSARRRRDAAAVRDVDFAFCAILSRRRDGVMDRNTGRRAERDRLARQFASVRFHPWLDVLHRRRRLRRHRDAARRAIVGLCSVLQGGRGEAVTEPIDLPAYPRILVVALRRLGDVLLTTPLIRSLRRAWPLAKIDVLVFSDTAAHPRRQSGYRRCAARAAARKSDRRA